MNTLDAARRRFAEIAANPVVIAELTKSEYQGLIVVPTVESTPFSEISPLLAAYGGATIVTLPDDETELRFHVGTIERVEESETLGEPVFDVEDVTMGGLIRNERLRQSEANRRLSTHSRELVLA